MIYLDNAATTAVCKEVLDEMLPYFTRYYGNPGSVYNFGVSAKEAVAQARERVAEFIGANPEQIIFTSGGTEGNNMVFAGVRKYLDGIGKPHALVFVAEHDSVIRASELYFGENVKYIPSNKIGEADLDAMVNMINKDNKIGLVSIMYQNNETGAVNPVYSIAEYLRGKGILFHTDCVQAAGGNIIDMKKLKCDFATISSHKLNGPKGVGALYIKDKAILTPVTIGGNEQEFGLRGGTENVPGIVGFGKACELIHTHKRVCNYLALNCLFRETLSKEAHNYNLDGKLHFNSYNGESKVVNIRFDNVDAETLVLLLGSNDICVSAGSACSSHESKPSRVLTAMGLSPDEARDSIRVSFGMDTTRDEVIDAAKYIVSFANLLATATEKEG